LILGKLGLFSLVSWKLFDIQIIQSSKYKTLSKNNQINIEILFPVRGNILDRNNNLIASNKNTYDLFLIPEQTINIKETLDKLSEFISIDFKTKRKVIVLSKKVKKFQNVKILKNIGWKELEIIEANKHVLPGLHLQLVSIRVYPYDRYLSHILGYTNQPSEVDMNLPYINNMPTLNIGKTGIERILNENLVGVSGKKEIEINAYGREIREISKQPSKKGIDVNISVDLRVQKFAHQEINKYKSGSIVLMNINSGEIISMVSIPDFDPNLIIKKPNKEYWNTLLTNDLSPLINRCIQGLYSPGSTFKMIVALAALRKGLISIKDTEFCSGKINYGDRIYHCWKTLGHGKMNIVNAIKESCDVFFYNLSKKIGIDEISKMAKEFGLGQITSLGFNNEKKGIVPSKKWKKNVLKENWYGGETLITAIGQGYIMTTPLQLALMTARIANDGKKVQPTLFKQTIEKQYKKINLKSEHINLIKNSMYKVINESGGTAYNSRSKLYNISGKTGTSQVKKITLKERESEDFRKKELDWKNKDHALFVGYMPSEKPKYAISVVIEHGGSGSSVAAPIAKNIFDFINNLNFS
jgi:penicillin-binding protein 2